MISGVGMDHRQNHGPKIAARKPVRKFAPNHPTISPAANAGDDLHAAQTLSAGAQQEIV
ncbi:hypothetical protein KBA01_08280 [Kozakia baliensis]|nr:hypothetical protein KBA01_08280 [Kozakia baliensis]